MIEVIGSKDIDLGGGDALPVNNTGITAQKTSRNVRSRQDHAEDYGKSKIEKEDPSVVRNESEEKNFGNKYSSVSVKDGSIPQAVESQENLVATDTKIRQSESCTIDHDRTNERSESKTNEESESRTDDESKSIKDDGRENTSKSELQQAFDELCDPLLPVRGHALISLCRLVKRKDAETLAKQDTVLKIFLENIAHFDSYLYLASVNGLVAMTDRFPDVVVPALVREVKVTKCKGQDGSEVSRSPDTRVKIGECLVQTSKALGRYNNQSDMASTCLFNHCVCYWIFVGVYALTNLHEKVPTNKSVLQ